MSGNSTNFAADFLAQSPSPLDPGIAVPSFQSSNPFEESLRTAQPSSSLIVPELGSTLSLNPVSRAASGWFTVGDSGNVSIDYLFDGGAFEGELGIFSLSGLEAYTLGSNELIQEVTRRVLSQSTEGYLAISDALEGARFSSGLGWEGNFNSGAHLGVKTFTMNAGDRFGIVTVANGTFQDLLQNPNGGKFQTLFSMAEWNPKGTQQFGQLTSDTSETSVFAFEDLRLDIHSDRDYNDMVFQIRGATATAIDLSALIDDTKDWRDSAIGTVIQTYVAPYDNPQTTQPTDYSFPKSQQPLIGIIDTGFASNNPDIDYSRITLGRDYVDGDTNPLLTAGEGNEHGTHILGIIGATQNNGIGIDGINDQAPIWLGRAIGSGKWAESLVEFVNQTLETQQPNAVVNLSLDLTQRNPDGSVTTRYEFTPEERAALEYARQSGVLIVASAGNDGGVMSVLGQASQEFDNIITVGAADGLNRADYSSYGYGLDILAPGGTDTSPAISTAGDGLGSMVGTSVATAHVTGAISQVWAANPSLNYRQVIELIKSTATDLGVPDWDSETGSGLVNTAAAVNLAKATQAETYLPVPLAIPDTWNGEGTVIPLERPTPPSSQGFHFSSSFGFNSLENNTSQFVRTVVSNGVTIHYYTDRYQVVQPNGTSVWYAIGTGIPVDPASGVPLLTLRRPRVQPDNGSIPRLHMGYPNPLTQVLPNSVPRLQAGYMPGETSSVVDSVYFADVNGDLKDDAIVVNNFGITVRSSDGTKFLPNNFPYRQDWSTEPFFGSLRTYFTDVTGDGKADAIAVNHDGIVVKRSTGSSFSQTEQWTINGFSGEKGTFFADVTGDGKVDAIAVNQDGIVVRPSNGNQFGAPLPWTTQGFFGEKGTFFADVNGDGRADAIAVDEDGVKVRLSTGNGFAAQNTWTDIGYSGSIGTYFADVDGDYKADAIVVNDQRINNRVTVRRSTGSQFRPNEDWTQNGYAGNLGTYFADVTGDGRADAIANNDAREGERVFIRRSTGQNFSPNERWTDIGYAGNGGHGSLVKGSGHAIYLIVGNEKRWIPNPKTLESLRFSGMTIQNISDADLNGIPTGNSLPAITSHLVRGSGPNVYMMVNGFRRHVPNPTTLGAMGLDWGNVQNISDQALQSLPEGRPLPSISQRLLRSPNHPQVYFMENGLRRLVPDPTTFGLMGFNWANVQLVDYHQLNDIPLGAPLPPIAPPPLETPLHGNPTASNPLKGFKYPLPPGIGKTSPFGGHIHYQAQLWAYDIANNGVQVGTPVYAMRSGTIVAIRQGDPDIPYQGVGNYVRIQHDGGYQSYYLHLRQNFASNIGLRNGQQVKAGDLIGYIGLSGQTSGAHLHVQVDNGNYLGDVPFLIG